MSWNLFDLSGAGQFQAGEQMSAESDYKCSKCGYEWCAIPPSKCPQCRLADRDDKLHAEALRLFRKVHGPGDGGSAVEFYCLNPSVKNGWLKLAREIVKLKNKKRSRS